MATVTEIVDAYPIDDWSLRIQRNEQLLFAKPGPPVSKFLQEYPLLQVYHFDTKYTPSTFAPPQDVFDSDHVRVEWQKMNGRQPFYHRNLDVDEISFHISGERTLITERGSVDLHEGDFARIPVYTAHDNYGVNDVHLIFYFTAPMKEQLDASRQTEPKIPPFEGWQPQQITEVITECLGTPGCDKAYSLIDESLTLQRAFDVGTKDRINVINASKIHESTNETIWLYKSDLVWLGSTKLSPTESRLYRRHRRADEVQYQVKGSRTLVTQRGTIHLEPGDFVSIPMGTAFTSIVRGESTHLSVLSRYPTEPKAKASKVAEESSWEKIDSLLVHSNGL